MGEKKYVFDKDFLRFKIFYFHRNHYKIAKVTNNELIIINILKHLLSQI